MFTLRLWRAQQHSVQCYLMHVVVVLSTRLQFILLGYHTCIQKMWPQKLKCIVTTMRKELLNQYLIRSLASNNRMSRHESEREVVTCSQMKCTERDAL